MRQAKGYGQWAMGKILPAVLLAVMLTGCASRPVGPSADYERYVTAVERIAEIEAGVDRTIWGMTVGSEPVVLPPGTHMFVRAPAPALQIPVEHRDHSYEAELAYYGQLWSVVGGVAIPAASAAYGAYNNRKMIGDIMRYAGGASFTATEASQINFSGGWGDRSWGYQGGGFSEVLTPDVYEVRPEVVVVPAGGE
jgi:hypothetical protein